MKKSTRAMVAGLLLAALFVVTVEDPELIPNVINAYHKSKDHEKKKPKMPLFPQADRVGHEPSSNEKPSL